MPKRDYFVAIVLIFLILVVSYSIYIVFDKAEVLGAKVVSQEVNNQSLNSETEVGSQEESTEFSTLNICYKESCKIISSEDMEAFYIDDKIDVQSVYMYILEYVVPYFEQFNGKKILVKNSKGSFYTWQEDSIIDMDSIYVDIANLLKESGQDGKSLKYDLYKKESPGTDGKYTSRYIEIDNSRQKLYVWEDGEVVKEINLSAAKSGWEVYGVFPIVDKGIEPMAPSGNYMPYWMAFYYSSSQDSWYGLHGLVWWYDGNGNVIHENTDYIGVRRSKGCIRMLKDDAKYLYDRYEKGDHILIHE